MRRGSLALYCSTAWRSVVVDALSPFSCLLFGILYILPTGFKLNPQKYTSFRPHILMSRSCRKLSKPFLRASASKAS